MSAGADALNKRGIIVLGHIPICAKANLQFGCGTLHNTSQETNANPHFLLKRYTSYEICHIKYINTVT